MKSVARKFGLIGLVTAATLGLAACQSGMNSEDRALLEQFRVRMSVLGGHYSYLTFGLRTP